MPIRFEPGVSTAGLAPGGVRILGALDGLSDVLGVDLTVTSVTDGNRLPTDPHPLGNAADARTFNLSEAQVLTGHKWLQGRLGPDFTVLYEVREKPTGVLGSIAYVNSKATGPHWHIQVRKGFGPWPKPR